MPVLVDVALVALAVAGIVASIALLPRATSSRWARALQPAARSPEQLDRVERTIAAASTSALHAHAYLRPLLIDIATSGLARHGRALDANCRELLGDPLWEFVRPDRPFPDDRHAPGVSPSALARMLEVLERL
jgi:hypothetical protein